MKNINRQITALIIIVILSLIPFSASAQPERFDVPVGNSVHMGPADAPITIFEFLDFQ